MINLTCRMYHIDITQDLIPVSPAAHYLMGGIKTDLHGATTIRGLYAAGEVACTGVHGANRLASKQPPGRSRVRCAGGEGSGPLRGRGTGGQRHQRRPLLSYPSRIFGFPCIRSQGGTEFT